MAARPSSTDRCSGGSRFARLLIAFFAAVSGLLEPAGIGSTRAHAEDIPALYSGRDQFLKAIEAERPKHLPRIRVTGITVPHHLLAADLIARGFWAASGNAYNRIILISPDHFSRSRRPLATTRADMDTPFGVLRNDEAATSELLSNAAVFEENGLFDREHGIAALLPFAKYFFPAARIVPVVVSYGSTRAHWDAAVAALEKLVGPGTLIVQSTDYSHYLPHRVAIARDQETLSIIAANDVEAVARLLQPQHLDSKGAQYIQMRLQNRMNRAHGTVIANRNSTEYGAIGTKTTSYIVTVYSPEPADGSKLRYGDQEIVFFGGDTFIGRWLTQPLSDPAVTRVVLAKIKDVTGDARLIVNLEGVLLDDPPNGIGPDLHTMHASLAIPILRALKVRAATLANNHSHDLGRNGFNESVAILQRNGIVPLAHLKPANLGRFGLVAVNFIGVRDYRGYPVVKKLADLNRLCRLEARSPLIAYVHWGREYTRQARPVDHAAARALHDCGVNVIVGAHSHKAATRIEAPRGGEFQMVYSLGNLLFDQRGDRASTALLELRIFKQSTVVTRLIPLSNLFELAYGELAGRRR